MGRTNILRIEQIKFRDAETVKPDVFRVFFQKHQKHSMLAVLDFESIKNIK